MWQSTQMPGSSPTTAFYIGTSPQYKTRPSFNRTYQPLRNGKHLVKAVPPSEMYCHKDQPKLAATNRYQLPDTWPYPGSGGQQQIFWSHHRWRSYLEKTYWRHCEQGQQDPWICPAKLEWLLCSSVISCLHHYGTPKNWILIHYLGPSLKQRYPQPGTGTAQSC